MVEPTHLKNMLVKLDHFPRYGRGENKTCLKPPPSYLVQHRYDQRSQISGYADAINAHWNHVNFFVIFGTSDVRITPCQPRRRSSGILHHHWNIICLESESSKCSTAFHDKVGDKVATVAPFPPDSNHSASVKAESVSPFLVTTKQKTSI